MDQEQVVETVETVETVQTVEGLGELTEKVDGLVEVLTVQAEQTEQAEPTAEELQAEQQLLEEQQLQAEQQLMDEQQFRTDLLLALSEVKSGLVDLNENTQTLILETESNNSVVSEVAPYAKQGFEWLIIAIVVCFLLWVVKQFEDMFNAAFR